MERIFVTGASTWTGGNFIRRIETRNDVEVFAVDDHTPRIDFKADFQQLSLDRLALAQYILEVEPTVVVHLQSVQHRSEEGRNADAEERIVGALALFGAIERLTSVRSVVVKSDTAIYGASPRNPSVLSETTRPQGRPSRYQRDLLEMERFIGETAGRHPSTTFTTLRFAPIFGPQVANPLSRYLTLPLVPTLMGFDPRLQFIHEQDAVNALVHAIDDPTPGTFNVAADGQMYLSRVLRLGRRLPQPLPGRMFDAALRELARVSIPAPEHLKGLLKNGRITNTALMHTTFGFDPSHTCRQTVLNAYGLTDDAS
ncbi:MAG: NAD-dependent epimerase/dehydratase family protein [Actinomycetia bacterium]|nr:NAD-dependent epimerase/dehydratase family protein [Actinomycetes bacterium]